MTLFCGVWLQSYIAPYWLGMHTAVCIFSNFWESLCARHLHFHIDTELFQYQNYFTSGYYGSHPTNGSGSSAVTVLVDMVAIFPLMESLNAGLILCCSVAGGIDVHNLTYCHHFITYRLSCNWIIIGQWKSGGKFGHILRLNKIPDNPLAHVSIRPLPRYHYSLITFSVSLPGLKKCVTWHFQTVILAKKLLNANVSC